MYVGRALDTILVVFRARYDMNINWVCIYLLHLHTVLDPSPLRPYIDFDYATILEKENRWRTVGELSPNTRRRQNKRGVAFGSSRTDYDGYTSVFVEQIGTLVYSR